MKLALSAPTDYEKFCKVVDLDKHIYLAQIKKIAEYLAKSKIEIVIVPHKGSVPELLAQHYKEFEGKKVYGVIPMNDKEFGIDYLNQEICDEIVDADTWRNVPETLLEFSDKLLVLGLGPGVFVEIGQAKWFPVEKIFVIDEFISAELHDELTSQLPIQYVFLEHLEMIK